MSSGDLEVRVLDGPPDPGFDCGRPAQNRFLAECAWEDQEERVSVTYLYLSRDRIAGFATVSMDSLELGTRERSPRIRYAWVGALKLAQLGVDRSFQGRGLGRGIVQDVVGLAQGFTDTVGCRFVSLDAQPDLVAWYEAQGFRINKVMQKRRVEAAARRGSVDPPVSMRFDIRR
ncbi:MAG TPA: GNAT family N-acetyltransferase [Longimicrobium sp.]|nr:GNAT family N-acetyltransferase [Longimicrobium sp.]